MSDLDSRSHGSKRLWIIAGLTALALHAGGAALAFAHLKADDDDEDVGAPAIEIGLELTSPRLDASDLPPGPDSDASVASPDVPEQKAEVKDSDLPKDTPNQTDEADRMVTPNEVKKPVEDDAKVATVQTEASQQSAAAEATATPSLENVPQGPRSVAPVEGVGETARRVRATWQKALMAHLDRHLRYPADRAGKRVEIVVSFVLDRLGHVLSARIAKGSGDPAFDEAALATVRRSDPVPQPPPAVADEGLSFTLPVIFKKGKG